MSDLDLAIPKSPVTDESYVVSCWKCDEKFNAAAAQWCGCAEKLLTIKCPKCASCFCAAPFAYKRKFWNEAPRKLRESASRFGIASRSADVPSAGQLQALEATAVSGPNVLIVDDEEPIRSLAACFVEQLGYTVSTAASAEEALVMIDATSFDVVPTDALMPKMDGRELCRSLKQKLGDRIKVILMTSLYKASHYRNEARNVFKVDEQLAKPLRYEELRAALQRVAPVAGTQVAVNAGT